MVHGHLLGEMSRTSITTACVALSIFSALTWWVSQIPMWLRKIITRTLSIMAWIIGQCKYYKSDKKNAMVWGSLKSGQKKCRCTSLWAYLLFFSVQSCCWLDHILLVPNIQYIELSTKANNKLLFSYGEVTYFQMGVCSGLCYCGDDWMSNTAATVSYMIQLGMRACRFREIKVEWKSFCIVIK